MKVWKILLLFATIVIIIILDAKVFANPDQKKVCPDCKYYKEQLEEATYDASWTEAKIRGKNACIKETQGWIEEAQKKIEQLELTVTKYVFVGPDGKKVIKVDSMDSPCVNKHWTYRGTSIELNTPAAKEVCKEVRKIEEEISEYRERIKTLKKELILLKAELKGIKRNITYYKEKLNSCYRHCYKPEEEKKEEATKPDNDKQPEKKEEATNPDNDKQPEKKKEVIKPEETKKNEKKVSLNSSNNNSQAQFALVTEYMDQVKVSNQNKDVIKELDDMQLSVVNNKYNFDNSRGVNNTNNNYYTPYFSTDSSFGESASIRSQALSAFTNPIKPDCSGSSSNTSGTTSSATITTPCSTATPCNSTTPAATSTSTPCSTSNTINLPLDLSGSKKEMLPCTTTLTPCNSGTKPCFSL